MTDDNIDAFLKGLDLFLEECDGIRMKFHLRFKVRERGIDIVLVGDERDFERGALQPGPCLQRLELLAGAGCVLVRDDDVARHTFAVPDAYLEAPPRGTGAWPDSPNLRARSSRAASWRSRSGWC